MAQCDMDKYNKTRVNSSLHYRTDDISNFLFSGTPFNMCDHTPLDGATHKAGLL
jgi:hypothetical protein